MALMAGTASRCTYRGVLRVDRYPYYICVHEHRDKAEARQCARKAKAYMDEHTKEGAPLPNGWINYNPQEHGV